MRNVFQRKINLALRQKTKSFRRNPKNWFQRYGANLAGGLWNSGNALQLILGAAVMSPRIISASILNISSSSSSMLFGQKNWGIVATGVLGVAGNALFLLPNLASGDVSIWTGYVVSSCATSIGIFGSYLSKKFKPDTNPLATTFTRQVSHFIKTALHNTLGRPRRMMGTTMFLARFPIIAGAVALGQWTTAAPFAVWALGDLAFSISREEAAKPRAQEASLASDMAYTIGGSR